MRALAQFVMRGPLQAGGVAAVTTAIPLLFWVGAAVIGLVILRLGISQGLGIGLWALMPALGWAWFGQDPTSVAVLLNVALMASVLRLTFSWENTLLAGSILALVMGGALPLLYPGLLEQLTQAGVNFYQSYNAEVAEQLGSRLESVVRQTMNASMAGTFLILSVVMTMVARSWQASLYNPGGFREEFHAFRLSRKVATGCALVMVAGPVTGFNAMLLAWIAGVPLIFAGLALIHGLLGRRGKGIHWLVIFYIALVLLSPSLLLLLLAVAFVDSWLNIRSRVRPAGPAE